MIKETDGLSSSIPKTTVSNWVKVWALLDIAYVQTEDEARDSEGLEIQISPSRGTWLERFTAPLWTAHVHPSFGNPSKAGADARQGLGTGSGCSRGM